jgi:hypothetical protein
MVEGNGRPIVRGALVLLRFDADNPRFKLLTLKKGDARR